MPDAIFGWDTLKWAWTNRAEILAQLRNVREWFRSDPGRGILIIGPGGVGKTTLARLLSGDFDWLTDDPWDYTGSVGVEEFTLKDDPKVEIVVPPGQSKRLASSWVDIERDLAGGKYRGVIVVSAYGHHNLTVRSYKDHALYRGNKDGFVTSHTQACRDDEIALVKRIAVGCRTVPGKLWMMSVVAKEDLWWPSRQNVEAFYTSGRYSEEVAEIATAKGLEHFRHEVLSASLVISNLLTDAGEGLVKNVEGYDHRQQVQSVRRLFEVMAALREWEGKA